MDKMRFAERFLAVAAIVLGVAQAAVATPLFFRALTEPALWFANGGLSLALLGALNLTHRRVAATALRRLTLVTNVVFSLFWVGMAAALWEKFLRHPASFTGVVVVLALTGLSFRRAQVDGG